MGRRDEEDVDGRVGKRLEKRLVQVKISQTIVITFAMLSKMHSPLSVVPIWTPVHQFSTGASSFVLTGLGPYCAFRGREDFEGFVTGRHSQ